MAVHERLISLDGAGGTGVIDTRSAQVLQWTPSDDGPVLWTSRRADLGGSAPVRGGIPASLPVFGERIADALASDPTYSVRRTWELVGGDQSRSASQAVAFRLGRDGRESGGFPGRLGVLLRVALTDDLVVSLDVTNEEDHEVVVEEALRVYLAVGDVKDTTIDGLEGTTYLDRTRPRPTWRTQHGEVALVGRTDRLHRCASTVVIHDPRNRRDIIIDKDGSADTAVWTPWAEGAAQLSDMGPEEWQHFVCVAVANAGEDALHLAPGEVHQMVLVLHVDPMA